MIRKRIMGAAAAVAIAGGGLVALAPATSAGAAQALLTCSGTKTVALLNPTLGSDDAKYSKIAVKRMDVANTAKYHLSLTGAEDFGPAAPANTAWDATDCAVDAGIRTNIPGTNSASGKENPFDNQTNGQTNLSMTSSSPFVPGIAGSISGTSSCNRDDVTLLTDYPNAYPLQGKLIFKYSQQDALLKQIQNQFYVRLGTDPLDTDITHITLHGIVIKGPGIGGDVDATLSFGAAYSTKNLNLLDCTATTAAGNASLAFLLIQAADGPDVGTAVDDLVVSIPS